MNYESLIQSVNDIAKKAGEAILEVYSHHDVDIKYKSDDSPLTAADYNAHKVIVSELEKLNVGPILSEEDAEISYEERRHWQQYWLVDPLDGTKEFIKKNGEFTVNIALIKQGIPVLGVVYAPVKELLYYGADSLGAFCVDTNGSRSISVAGVPSEDEPWRIAGSRSHQSEAFKHFLIKFPQHELMSMGSSLKLCMVADGSVHLYPRLGLTSEWDTAAAQAVVEAAGGAVINWETGKPLRYNTKDSLLNPFFIVCAEPNPEWFV